MTRTKWQFVVNQYIDISLGNLSGTSCFAGGFHGLRYWLKRDFLLCWPLLFGELGCATTYLVASCGSLRRCRWGNHGSGNGGGKLAKPCDELIGGEVPDTG